MQKTPGTFVSRVSANLKTGGDLDIANNMIGFSHHIRLDQKRMLSIFCCHKDSRVMAFLHGLIISKLFVSDFFAKIKITTKKKKRQITASSFFS